MIHGKPQPINLLMTLRRRPDAHAVIRGSAQYSGLSGTVRFYQTCQGVLGRTVIIHSGPDDFTAQPGGGAGSKIACGQIRAAD